MKFLINKSVLGSKSHFVISDNEFISQNHNNENLWSIDKCDESIKSLTLVSSLNSRTIPQISNEIHKKQFDLLGVKDPNWILSLGKQNFKEYIRKIKD